MGSSGSHCSLPTAGLPTWSPVPALLQCFLLESPQKKADFFPHQLLKVGWSSKQAASFLWRALFQSWVVQLYLLIEFQQSLHLSMGKDSAWIRDSVVKCTCCHKLQALFLASHLSPFASLHEEHSRKMQRYSYHDMTVTPTCKSS